MTIMNKLIIREVCFLLSALLVCFVSFIISDLGKLKVTAQIVRLISANEWGVTTEF